MSEEVEMIEPLIGSQTESTHARVIDDNEIEALKAAAEQGKKKGGGDGEDQDEEETNP